jgi:ADP-ribose pyrophosphatase YjhB (NUDIX family)
LSSAILFWSVFVTRLRPAVGVAAVVWRDADRQELLIGMGHSRVDRDTLYALPGGHWESGESLVEAVARETREEAGVEVNVLALISVYDFYNAARERSYVTLGFAAVLANGFPRVLEPQNKLSWIWATPDHALTLPLFPPDEVLIRRCRSGPLYEA